MQIYTVPPGRDLHVGETLQAAARRNAANRGKYCLLLTGKIVGNTIRPKTTEAFQPHFPPSHQMLDHTDRTAVSMRSSHNEVAAAPKRQSCDRCHSQKLRCTRPDNSNTGPCERCIRKGSQCVYSLCLPKGRPSLYRASDGPVAAKGPSQSSSGSSASPSTTPISPATFVTPDLHHGDFTPVSPPESISNFPDFSSSFWPEDHIIDSMMDVMPCSMTGLDPTMELQRLESAGFPGQSMADGMDVGRDHAQEDKRGLGNDLAESISATSGSRGGHYALAADKIGFEVSIAHLSRLSTRLSQLLGSSRRFLADAVEPSCQPKNQDPALQVQLGVETVFKSINAWLLHGSADADTTSRLNLGQTNAFHLLHHVFSASNHLLEILSHIRASVSGSTTNPSAAASSPPQPLGLGSGSHVETSSASSSVDGGHPSYSVVHHLVLVCMTLLLNMYITMLIALQRSADALNTSLRQRARNCAEPNDHMVAASRTHLQLVSVVQLCSYFIKRQNQSLDMMMLSSQALLHTPLSGDYDPLQSVSSDALSDVKIEVDQRLRRLQESLYIVA